MKKPETGIADAAPLFSKGEFGLRFDNPEVRTDGQNLSRKLEFLLRELLQGDVASMTAARLSDTREPRIDNDRLFAKPLADFQALVLARGTRLADLKAFLETELPPGRPAYLKVLFLEAMVRRLGVQWTRDDCDFIDVTIGTARMQQLIHALSAEFQRSQGRLHPPRALIVTTPSEQHTLMTHLLGLLFESLGWSRRISGENEAAPQRLATEIRAADVVCVSWASERLRDEVAALVRLVRLNQNARHIPIVFGGKAALDGVDFLVGLGVDCVCDSVYSAASICEHYVLLHRSDIRKERVVKAPASDEPRTEWLLR
ncbi:B12-binding domain-containing protein [Zhengella sp. ZM62]|uniref:cobalamin B12-binding domain-containing protein n=1 Tax=Zhengella sedimenti TaxID=3390035 RepID=UPI0039761D66